MSSLGKAQEGLLTAKSALPEAQKQVRSASGRYGYMSRSIKPELANIGKKFKSEARGIRGRQFANVAARTAIIGGGALGAGEIINSQIRRNRPY